MEQTIYLKFKLVMSELLCEMNSIGFRSLWDKKMVVGYVIFPFTYLCRINAAFRGEIGSGEIVPRRLERGDKKLII
jgi:hypothetical protein